MINYSLSFINTSSSKCNVKSEMFDKFKTQ